jgi:hypothetical protein
MAPCIGCGFAEGAAIWWPIAHAVDDLPLFLAVHPLNGCDCRDGFWRQVMMAPATWRKRLDYYVL